MKLKHLILMMSVALSSQAVAQSNPDYPKFTIRGEKAGGAGQTWESNAVGTVTAANGLASFHSLALGVEGMGDKLKFRYKCYYKSTSTNGPITSPTYSNGQECPAGGRPGSHYIRAINVDLDGSLAKDYILKAKCSISYFNQKHVDVLPEVGNGQWCGCESGGAPDEWISSITIEMHRK